MGLACHHHVDGNSLGFSRAGDLEDQHSLLARLGDQRTASESDDLRARRSFPRRSGGGDVLRPRLRTTGERALVERSHSGGDPRSGNLDRLPAGASLRTSENGEPASGADTNSPTGTTRLSRSELWARNSNRYLVRPSRLWAHSRRVLLILSDPCLGHRHLSRGLAVRTRPKSRYLANRG